jgi:RsiW-degrading membrane proteinase PrsW (M82 family)
VTHAPSAQPAPTTAPKSVSTAVAATPGPAEQASRAGRKRSLVVPATIAFLLIGIAGLLVAGFLLLSLGPGAVAVGAFMALIPLAIVLIAIRWIDRWEREPRSVLLFAFLWGSMASVFVALAVGVSVDIIQDQLGAADAERDLLGAVVQAPIVEEGVKGLGVLLIFLVVRRYFDGPVDGIVYAATVAAGFAFTENVLYFGAQIVDDGSAEGTIGIFVIRGLMSPFAHVMFTVCTGLAIGIGCRRGTLGGILGFLIGLVPAMALHALWNGATYAVGDDFLTYYVVVQVPLFVGAIVVVVLLRRAESRLTRTRLNDYAAAGWFTEAEIAALATPAGRRQSMAWARSRGLGVVMRGYLVDVTKLASIRDRLVTGRAVDGATEEEAALLAAILARRSALLGSP